MDSGGYNIILNLGRYCIDDCGSYFMIYEDHKYIGEFKNKDNAFLWVFKKHYLG
jgi:hypothetical protein